MSLQSRDADFEPPRRRTTDRLDRRETDLTGRPAPVKPRRRREDGWLERWIATVSDLTRLKNTHPMMDAVIDEQRGRRIRIGGHWLADFASCNYLGFDLDPEIAASIDEQVRRWGTHPSWSRLLGNPRLYPEIEERLTELLGAPDTLVLPTITHIHTSVLPVLARGGMLLLEAQAHRTVYDGATAATAAGASVSRFRLDDLDRLAHLLRGAPAQSPRVVCVD